MGWGAIPDDHVLSGDGGAADQPSLRQRDMLESDFVLGIGNAGQQA